MQRILVIDDDELSREVLSLLLGGEGWVVDVASCGEDALRLLAGSEAAPEVVLLDMQMPGISGEDLVLKLRTVCHTSIRLIAMSGSQPETVECSTFDGFLLKPFSMPDLSALLERLGGGPAGQTSENGPDLPPPNEVLDPQIFMTFKRMMGREPLRELYGLCLSDAEKQAAAMRSAAAAQDDANFRRSAHAIKGSLGMLGALELQRICGLLEEVGLKGDPSATLAELPAAIERLRRMLIGLEVDL